MVILKKKINLLDLLSGLIVLLVLIQLYIIFFYDFESIKLVSDYQHYKIVNDTTICLNLISLAINYLIILNLKKKKNELVLVAVVFFILFFNLRVVSFILTNFYSTEIALGGIPNVYKLNIAFLSIIISFIFFLLFFLL